MMTRAEMLAHLDAKAGAVRACYITVAPGQEATYLLKAEQARAYAAGAYTGTVPGLVQAEADATGEGAQESADRILSEEAAWAALAAQVESARRTGKTAISESASDAEALPHYAAALAWLVALMPG